VYEELKGAYVEFQPREFHLPDAMEHDFDLAKTPDDFVGLLLRYFPEVNSYILPSSYKLGDKKYHPTLPKGAVIGRFFVEFDPKTSGERFKVFEAVEAKLARINKQKAIAAVLDEAEKVALKGKKRRDEGPCTKRRTPPRGGSGEHDKYAAHVAKVNGYPSIKGKRTELTWTTADGASYPFDTFNSQNETEVWEVKTQHEWTSPLGMADAPYHVKGGLHERIYGLETQRLTGLYVATRCGLTFRYAVDNCEAYTGLNQAWAGLPPVAYIPAPGEKKVNCS